MSFIKTTGRRLDNGTYFDSTTKIWSGPLTEPIYNPKINLGQALLYKFDQNPKGVAQVCDHNGHELTYKQLKSQCIRVTENLRKFGYSAGDMVTTMARNGQALAPLVLGCFMLGTPINPLDATYQVDDIAHMFGITQPKAVFCDHDFVEKIEVALKLTGHKCEIFTFEQRVTGYRFIEELFEDVGIDESNYRAPYIGVPEKTPALLMCSSGTTGLPKAVKISHTHFLYKASMLACPMDSVLFCFSSIFWYTGMCCLLVGCLATIKRVITIKPFTPLYGLQIMDKYKISFIFAAPIHVSLMAQHPAASTMDLSAVNAFYTGGAFVSEPLKASMNQYLPKGKVMNCYALTEVGGVVTVPGKYDRVGSCGTLVDGMQVKVVDDAINNLGPGQQGEFYVRTLYTFLGYHKNEAATDETVDNEGWIHTGDIGYMDEDGYLYMVDRKKDIFKYAGYHVSPTDLEAVIETLPGVQYVCVVGVPGQPEGDYAAALVVRTPNCLLTCQEMCDAANAKLSFQKQIRAGVHFVDQLPRTTSGKVLRRKAQNIAIELYNGAKSCSS